MKRTISALLVLAMLFTIVPTMAMAGTSKITYAAQGGDLYFDTETGAIVDCDPTVTAATIPEKISGVTVTSIGEYAFHECAQLQNVVLPETIVRIESTAFLRCTALKTINIPASVSFLGGYAFGHCKMLEKISIPNSNAVTQTYTFSGCTLLTSAGPIGSGAAIEFAWTTAIPDHAFEHSELTSIQLPSGLTAIGYSAFNSCPLTSIDIPFGVKTLGESAFGNCGSLTTVMLPDTVTVIGAGAFWKCYSLSKINIPASVTSIENQTFLYCRSLKSAGPIGGGYDYEFGWTKEIPDNAFAGAGLTSIALPPTITSIGGYAFADCQDLTDISLPITVNEIGPYAFSTCLSLAEIAIPNGVTSLDCAFQYCYSLRKITIPASVTTMDDAFKGTTYGDTYHPLFETAGPIGGGYDYEFGWTGAIPEKAFGNCSDLKSIVLPQTVTAIGDDAFRNCDSLTELKLPSALTAIGEYALYSCSALTSIRIPEGVTFLDNVFCGCTNLQTVYLPKSLTKIFYAFWGCDNLTDVYYAGTEAEWDNTYVVSTDEDTLQNATIHFNWEEEEETEPKITGLYPAHGSDTIGHNAANPPEFRITFNREIAVDSGNWPLLDFTKTPFSIYHASDDQLIYQAAENSFLPGTCGNFSVTVSGNQLVISPTNAHLLFDISTEYYITLGEGFVKLKDNSVSPGIAKNAWRFFSSQTEKTGTFRFPSSVRSGDVICDYTYSDDYFSGNSKVYNRDLAEMSLKLALSAYSAGNAAGSGYTKEAAAKNVHLLMQEMEFSDIDVSSYEGKPTQNTIGSAMGHKKLRANGQDYTLIAVVIRGGNYEAEWAGNFDVASTSEHQGFASAAEQVKTRLLNYINQYASGDKIKLWIVGYSRAAAVSNQLAGTLDRSLYGAPIPLDLGAELSMSDFYTYTFETPMPTALAVADDTKWNNIHNIVNPIDVVTKVAPKSWSYHRYGMSYYLPSFENSANPDFADNILKVAARTIELCGTNCTAVFSTSQGALLDEALGCLKILSPDGTISMLLQNFIQKKMVKSFENTDDEWDGEEDLKYFYDALSTSKSIIGLDPVSIAWALFSDMMWQKSKETGKTLLEAGMNAHRPELCLAWMELMGDESTYVEPRYRRLRVNCQVDISVYDGYGNLVAQFIDDEPQIIPGSNIGAYLDRNGQKTVILPLDGEYTVSIIATDSGEMTYSVSEYNFETGDTERVVNFYRITLEEGDTLAGIVGEKPPDAPAEYTLKDPQNRSLIPEDLSGEEVAMVQVDVDVEGEGYAMGAGTRVKGEFALLTAVPAEGMRFRGWFYGDTRLETATDYRFCVTGDITLTAKFVSLSAPEEEKYQVTVTDSYASASGTGEYLSGQIVEIYAGTRDGYSFSGWMISDSNVSISNPADKDAHFVMPDHAITVTATWSKNDPQSGGGVAPAIYILTFQTNGGSKIDSVSKTGGSNIDLTSYVPTRDGFSFAGWFSDEALTKKVTSIKLTGDTSVYAGWTPNTIKNPFLDINENDPRFYDVMYVFEKGLMKGTSATAFSPDTTITRGMIVTILYRLEGAPAVSGTYSFEDVVPGAYYENAVAWAAANGIAKGYGAGKYGPEDKITCEQLATILYRYADYKGYNVSDRADLGKFPDADKISGYAIDAVAWANANGLVNSKSNDTLDPKGDINRSEAAVALHIFCKNIVK